MFVVMRMVVFKHGDLFKRIVILNVNHLVYDSGKGKRAYQFLYFVGYIFVNFTKSRKGGTHAYTAPRGARPLFIPFCYDFKIEHIYPVIVMLYTENI